MQMVPLLILDESLDGYWIEDIAIEIEINI